MSYMDELNFWLNDGYFDQKTKDELLAIRNKRQKWKIVFTRTWNSVPAVYVA